MSLLERFKKYILNVLCKEEITKYVDEHIKSMNITIRLMNLRSFLGMPVIGISNEYIDPVIGYGTGVDQEDPLNPLLIVHDYLSGREIVATGKIFIYTPQRFNALYKLDKNEIRCLIFRHHNRVNEVSVKGEPLTRNEAIDLLRKNGFLSGNDLKIPSVKDNLSFENKLDVSPRSFSLEDF